MKLLSFTTFIPCIMIAMYPLQKSPSVSAFLRRVSHRSLCSVTQRTCAHETERRRLEDQALVLNHNIQGTNRLGEIGFGVSFVSCLMQMPDHVTMIGFMCLGISAVEGFKKYGQLRKVQEDLSTLHRRCEENQGDCICHPKNQKS